MNTPIKPNKIVRTSRSVIEGETVAILLSKQDCDDLHAALCGYSLGEWKGNILSWQQWVDRCKNLAEGIDQLRNEAFPK